MTTEGRAGQDPDIGELALFWGSMIVILLASLAVLTWGLQLAASPSFGAPHSASFPFEALEVM